MKTLAIMSQKGGSGKTTLAVHLAAYAAWCKVKVGLVDLDPQASAQKWNARRQPDDPKSPRLDVLQSTATELPRVQAIAVEQGLGLLILDTAPHANSAAALVAQRADYILMPCRPALFDLDAIASTVSLVADVRAEAAVVFNAVQRGRLADEAREGLERQGIPVLARYLSQRVAYSNAVIDGRAVHEFEPRGKAAQEIAGLYGYITRLLGIPTGRARKEGRA